MAIKVPRWTKGSPNLQASKAPLENQAPVYSWAMHQTVCELYLAIYEKEHKLWNLCGSS